MDRGFVYENDRWTTTKAPGDEITYGRDLRKRFPGRSISSVEATASGCDVGTPASSGLIASALVSGGTLGQTASVKFACTLDDGQVTVRTLYFEIVAK